MHMDEIYTTERDIIRSMNELPPAVLEEIVDNPDTLAGYARVRLAALIKRLTDRVMNDPDTTVSQYNAVAETLRKIAMPPNKGNDIQSVPFSIQINLPSPTSPTTGRVIEHG